VTDYVRGAFFYLLTTQDYKDVVNVIITDGTLKLNRKYRMYCTSNRYYILNWNRNNWWIRWKIEEI